MEVYVPVVPDEHNAGTARTMTGGADEDGRGGTFQMQRQAGVGQLFIRCDGVIGQHLEQPGKQVFLRSGHQPTHGRFRALHLRPGGVQQVVAQPVDAGQQLVVIRPDVVVVAQGIERAVEQVEAFVRRCARGGEGTLERGTHQVPA